MNGRTLEFALSTALITIINLVFAYFVADLVSKVITKYFNIVINCLTALWRYAIIKVINKLNLIKQGGMNDFL